MRSGILTAGALMMFAAPAIGQETATATASASVRPKKICRYDIATGTVIPGHRTCRTATEWSTKHKENEVGADAYRNRGHGAFMRLPGLD